MNLNLISDPWIPVVDKTGARRIIAPWQMADDNLLRPDWPRADLNIACLELLIGLVYLVDPPANVVEWRARQVPDAARLREKLAALEPSFNLTGDGPLFLQDREFLAGEASPVDMLFIDSAGANTAKNNADLMVRRGRYQALTPDIAAMALYAFQAFAPSGGAGNRTSMRGGGPLVTLVDPGQGLWALIWANVPDGVAQGAQVLPWMRATRVSDTGAETYPPTGTSVGAEAFFGMPRRLRLVDEVGGITGVVQRPYGTNYAGWVHPLTPYYRMKVGEELLPVHPKAGRFGYRNWLGIVADAPSELRQRARSLALWSQRGRGGSVIVAGWAMDNMKPRDFTLSVQPYVALKGDAALMLAGLIEAAEFAALALRMALEPLLADGEAREAEREVFYVDTETDFQVALARLTAGEAVAEVAAAWLLVLRNGAVARFEALAVPGLDQRESDVVARIVQAHRNLTSSFRGFGKYGAGIYAALMLEAPVRKKKEVVA